MTSGTLYLVATPIGNLEDITFRAVRILKEVSLIAAEDTRHTKNLLNHFDVHTPLTAYHEHNKDTAGEKLIEKLLNGEDIAVVSDAGLPCIADPGAALVKTAAEKNIKTVPIPGANAALTALIASGLDTAMFTFVGFLPKTDKKAKERLLKLQSREETLIFYAAPHSLKDTLKKLAQTFGEERRTVIARELTKTFEEFKRGNLKEFVEFYETEEPRGEFAIIVEGGENIAAEPQEFDIKKLYDEKLKAGLNKKEAMREVAKTLNISRREVYGEILRENS